MNLVVYSDLSNGNWNPPCGWTGPDTTFYQSFDSADGFVLMIGTEAAISPVPLVSGMVRYIWPHYGR